MDKPHFPFYLNKTQLQPILEAVVGAPITAFTSQERPAVEGGERSGNTRLYTFRYSTLKGESGEATLVVKRCVWRGRSEAVHYLYLSDKEVPTPRFYGAVHNDRGEEVIFLERLTATGFRADSETEWRKMLSLLARFNACGITPDYAPHLHAFEQVGVIDANLWLLGLDASPSDEETEANLRACGIEDKDVGILLQAARTLSAQVAAQPQGLLHQDFLSDNLGWRGEREELVIFDLHKNALGPRFADVAPYLALPDWSSRAAFLDTMGNDSVSHRESLVRHYLYEYARYGGPTVSPQVFQEETTALFWMHKVAALGWLVEQKQQSRIREVLDFLYQVPVET